MPLPANEEESSSGGADHRRQSLSQSIKRVMRLQTHACKVCGKVFKRKDGLKAHMPTHSGEKKYVCNVCGKAMAWQSSYLEHMRRHTKDFPHKCSICDKAFPKKNYLLLHEKGHRGEKPFSCQSCDKAFVSRGKLLQHMRNHNNKETPKFLCDICGKSLSSKHNLREHRESVHDVRPPGVEPKTYSCGTCGRHFKSRRVAEVHQRVHTGEKPYACPHCPATFGHSKTLKDHVVRHTGEKPYQCRVCDKSFSLRSTLQRHGSVHRGTKPYPCPLCASSFTLQHNVRLHVRKFHRGALYNPPVTEPEDVATMAPRGEPIPENLEYKLLAILGQESCPDGLDPVAGGASVEEELAHHAAQPSVLGVSGPATGVELKSAVTGLPKAGETGTESTEQCTAWTVERECTSDNSDEDWLKGTLV